MRRIPISAVLLLSLCHAFVTVESAAAQAVELRTARPTVEGPTIDDMRQWFATTFGSLAGHTGRVIIMVHGQPELADTPITFRVTSASLDECVLKFGSIIEHSVSPHPLNENQTALRELDLASVRVEVDSKIEPPLFVVRGSPRAGFQPGSYGPGIGGGIWVWTSSQEAAERIARAVRHTATLCGGTSDPF